MIEEEMGMPLEQVFSKISDSPVAAASLGQVYRATLRSTEEEVAIKVSCFIISISFLGSALFSMFSVFSIFFLKKMGLAYERTLMVNRFNDQTLNQLFTEIYICFEISHLS